MDVPTPHGALVALASFVRERFADVGGSLPPWARHELGELLAGLRGGERPAAGRLAGVVVGPSAPFATTSYARARLLRQLHASGLLSTDEIEFARDRTRSGDGYVGDMSEGNASGVARRG